MIEGEIMIEEQPVLSFKHKDSLLITNCVEKGKNRTEVFLDLATDKEEIERYLSSCRITPSRRFSSDLVEPTDSFTLNDNLLIKGDNLLALHQLLKTHRCQIKCMYWDILYNTQNNSISYNDSFKHSSWLTMMKNRLEIAYKLLREDGVICIQCDDNEMHYLKVLCDEIFGREKFLNSIVVEMASSGGLKRSNKEKRLVKTKEYILVYTKNKFEQINSLLYDNWSQYDENYTIIFDKQGVRSLADEIKNNFSKYGKIKVGDYLKYQDIEKFLIHNSDIIFRRHGASAWAIANVESSEILWEDSNKNTRNMVVKVLNPNNNGEYELLMRIRSKDKGSYKWERLEPLGWNVINGELMILRGDLWKGFYKDMGNVSKEGSVKLSNGKKPERLISDLITAFTEEGDLVLDAYLGSGTTASVAHKMGRRYIGIEQLDNHFLMSQERLLNVINGDKGGISKTVNWQGGGSFVSCELKTTYEND